MIYGPSVIGGIELYFELLGGAPSLNSGKGDVGSMFTQVLVLCPEVTSIVCFQKPIPSTAEMTAMVFSRLATRMQHILLTVMKVLETSENFKAKSLIIRVGVAFEIMNKKAEKIRRRSRLRIKLLHREFGLKCI